jgi:hypothetical protein
VPRQAAHLLPPRLRAPQPPMRRRRQRHERDGRHYGQYRRHLRHPPAPLKRNPTHSPRLRPIADIPTATCARTGSRRGKCERFRVRRGAPSAPTPLLSASCVVTAAEAGGEGRFSVRSGAQPLVHARTGWEWRRWSGKREPGAAAAAPRSPLASNGCSLAPSRHRGQRRERED